MPLLNAAQVVTLGTSLSQLSSYQLMDLTQSLRAAGIVSSYSAALTDPAVLEAVVQDDALARRFADALSSPVAKLLGEYERIVSGRVTPAGGRGRKGKPRGISREIVQKLDALRDLQSLLVSLSPAPSVSGSGPRLFLPADSYWSEGVRAHFLPLGGQVWKRPSLSAVWRAARDLNQQVGDERPLSARSLQEAGGIWARALEREGMGRSLGEEVQETRHVAQILTWLGVKRVPEGRCDRELHPQSIGFKEVKEGRDERGREGLQPGDLVTYESPLFASAAVLTKTAPGGYPVEVMMLLGGHLFLGHPRLSGLEPSYWRLAAQPPDYLLLTNSPFEDHSVGRILYLDELLEVGEAIDFSGTRFVAVHRSSWSHLSSDEWIVCTDFAEGNFAIFHLTIQRSEEGRQLSVVIDYYGGKKQKTLPEFVPVAERSLRGIAGRLEFHQLDLFYKMVMPLSVLSEGGEELVRLGYREMNSPGWGRLPAKRIAIQNRRPSRRLTS